MTIMHGRIILMMPQYCHDLITLVTQTTKLALNSHRFTQCGIFICKSHLDFEYKYEKDSFLRENHISHSYILSVVVNVRVIKLETRLENRRLSSTHSLIPWPFLGPKPRPHQILVEPPLDGTACLSRRHGDVRISVK